MAQELARLLELFDVALSSETGPVESCPIPNPDQRLYAASLERRISAGW